MSSKWFGLSYDCSILDEYMCAGDDDDNTVRAFNAFRRISDFIDEEYKQNAKTTAIIQDTMKSVKEGTAEYSCLKFTKKEIAKLKELENWCGQKGMYDYFLFLSEIIYFLEAVKSKDEDDKPEIIHKPGTEFTDAEIEQIRYVEKWCKMSEYNKALADVIINFCEERLKSREDNENKTND